MAIGSSSRLVDLRSFEHCTYNIEILVAFLRPQVFYSLEIADAIQLYGGIQISIIF